MKKYLVGDKVKLVKFYDIYITAKYLGWLNDHEVTKYLNTGRWPVIRTNVFAPDGDKNTMFAIMCNLGINSTGQVVRENDFVNYIGTASLHDIDWISRKAETGYMIGEKAYWGCGVATEVVQLIKDYSFERLNLNKLTAGVVAGNTGSIKVLEKNGFKQFAINQQDYYLDGQLLDSHRFHNFQAWHYGRSY